MMAQQADLLASPRANASSQASNQVRHESFRSRGDRPDSMLLIREYVGDILIVIASMAAFIWVSRTTMGWGYGIALLAAWIAVYVTLRSRFETEHHVGKKAFFGTIAGGGVCLVLSLSVFFIFGLEGLTLTIAAAIIGCGLTALGVAIAARWHAIRRPLNPRCWRKRSRSTESRSRSSSSSSSRGSASISQGEHP